MDTITDYLKLIVKAEVEQAVKDMNKFDKAVDGSGKSVETLSGKVKKSTGFFSSMTGEIVKGVSIQRAAEAGFRKLISIVQETSEAYRTQQEVEENLAFAVNNSPYLDSSAIAGFEDFASSLQSVSVYGDETTLSFINMLIPLGRTEKQIQDIITTAADMDSRGIMSFDSAVRNLNKSFGGTTGELAEMFPELKDLTSEQLKAGKAVEILSKQFEGFAAGAAKTAKGEVQQFDNALGDLKEEIGAGWDVAISPARKALTGFITDITDSMKKSREFYDFISNPTLNLNDIEEYRKQLQSLGRELLADPEKWNIISSIAIELPSDEQITASVSILEELFEKKQEELAAEGYNVSIAAISEIFANTDINSRFDFLKEANKLILERVSEEHNINVEKNKEEEHNKNLLKQEEDIKNKAKEQARLRSENYKKWRKELYGQTEESRITAVEADLDRAYRNLKPYDNLPESEKQSDDYKQLIAIIPHLKSELESLTEVEKSAGQQTIDTLQEQIDLYGATEEEVLKYKMTKEGATPEEIKHALALQETYNQLVALDESYDSARSSLVSFSDYINEEYYNALIKANRMSKELAITVADLMTQFTDGSISIAVDGFSDLGAAFEDGKISSKEFASIMAKQAQALLEMLPLLFVQAGLQLIVNGQLGMGLGFIAAGLSSSFIAGFTEASMESSAKGNVLSGGEIVKYGKGGVANTTHYSAMPSGKTAEWAERGWEAYVPLTRTPSGELGVNASGVGGSSVNVIINNYSGEDVTTTETENGGEREIEIQIGKMIKSQVESGNLDGAMSRRYGIKAQGVR